MATKVRKEALLGKPVELVFTEGDERADGKPFILTRPWLRQAAKGKVVGKTTNNLIVQFDDAPNGEQDFVEADNLKVVKQEV